MDYADKQPVKGDCLGLLRIAGLDVISSKPGRILVAILAILHLNSLLFHVVYFLHSGSATVFFKYSPFFFCTIFGNVCLVHLAVALDDRICFLSKHICWPIDCAGSEVESRIKRQSLYISAFTAANAFLALFVGILIAVPREHDEELLLIVKLSRELFPSTILEAVYRCSIVFVVYIMTVHTIQINYLSYHTRFQTYLLCEHLRKMTSDYEEADLEKLVYCQRYQDEISRRLRFCVVRHIETTRELNRINRSCISKYILPFVLGGCAHGLGILIYIYLGIKHENHSVPRIVGCTVLFVLTFSSMIKGGQDVLNEGVNLPAAILETRWYTWNQNNKKTLLIFLLGLMKPYEMKFTNLLTINYSLGISILKVIYSGGSLLVQMKN